MDIKDFAQKVLHMRLKQQEYFRVAIECKQDPTKHTKRKKVLAESKQLEQQVDELIVKLVSAPQAEMDFGL
jgi:hypothetical protein